MDRHRSMTWSHTPGSNRPHHHSDKQYTTHSPHQSTPHISNHTYHTHCLQSCPNTPLDRSLDTNSRYLEHINSKQSPTNSYMKCNQWLRFSKLYSSCGNISIDMCPGIRIGPSRMIGGISGRLGPCSREYRRCLWCIVCSCLIPS